MRKAHFISSLLGLAMVAGTVQAASINMLMRRETTNGANAQYYGQIEVVLGSGFSGATVEASNDGGGRWFGLASDGSSFIGESEHYASWNDLLTTDLSHFNNWQVRVNNGSSQSVYAFDLNLAGLTDSIFPAAPVITSPVHGSTVTIATPTITWTSAATPALGLWAHVDGNSGGSQEVASIAGSIAIDATSWTLNPLPNGSYEAEVQNAALGSSSWVTAFTSISGPEINWTPYVPGVSNEWNDRPLIAALSTDSVNFSVNVPEPASLSLVLMGGLLLIRRRAA